MTGAGRDVFQCKTKDYSEMTLLMMTLEDAVVLFY